MASVILRETNCFRKFVCALLYVLKAAITAGSPKSTGVDAVGGETGLVDSF